MNRGSAKIRNVPVFPHVLDIASVVSYFFAIVRPVGLWIATSSVRA
jgi:hypothetical protein